MEPTIQRGDHIVVDTRAFRFDTPQHQNVVVFKKDGTFFIKRVIGVAGDVLEEKNGDVIVNGYPIAEPYIQHSRLQSRTGLTASDTVWMYFFGPVRVPQGKYYVMGDNRDVSRDSRSPDFGFVDGRSFVGKALYVFNTGHEGAIIK